jgi:hypothetical protein
MRKYSSNLAFVDLLFNLLVGFTSLLILAFLMINPISKTGEVTPPVKAFVEIKWDSESIRDIDLFVRGPDGNVVFYGNKDGAFMILDRDDLGLSNDSYQVNGKKVIIKRNYEITNFTDLPPGEYVIAVFYFSAIGEPLDVDFSIRTVSPHHVVYEGTVEGLTPRKEVTVVSFVVDEMGNISDLNTELQIPITGRKR